MNRKIGEQENKNVMLSQELERLNVSLRNASLENENYRKQLGNAQASISQYELEVSRKLSGYEQNINHFGKENEELKRKLQELSDLNRKLADYEKRMSMLSQ